MEQSAPFKSSLFQAARGGNLENLREILDRKGERGRLVINDHCIREALFVACRFGKVEACRILYNKLSSSGKRYYKVRTNYKLGQDSPLHDAVEDDNPEVVRLFVEEFGFNVNKKNDDGETLLLLRTENEIRLEMMRYLLEHGANPNQVGMTYEHILNADYDENHCYVVRPTDWAILNGNTEMLSLLLGHGGLVANRSSRFMPETWLSRVLLDKFSAVGPITRETKLAICRILVEHAQGESSTNVFLQSSLEYVVRSTECCEILLESGVVPTSRAIYAAIQGGKEAACRLLVQHGGVDPFLEVEGDANGDHAPSPFQEAARQEETSIFSFFLDAWDERFSSQGGKNDDGDYPIHVLCCDPKVSLEAIKLVGTRYPGTLATVDGEQGLFPFHFAAMWDAKLNLIFALLKYFPEAFSHLHLQAHSSTADDASRRSNDDRNITTSAAAYHHQGNTSTGSGSVDNVDETHVESDGPVQKRAKTAL